MEKHQEISIEAYNSSAETFANKIGSLENYNPCYDFLLSQIKDGDEVLDLACGPGNISAFLDKQKKLSITGYDLADEMLKIARKKIPQGNFINQSIIHFSTETQYKLIINGFGIPYLSLNQAETSFECSFASLRDGGLFYLSFMEGNREGFESTSFAPDEQFYVYYHNPETIKEILTQIGFSTLKEWILPYSEPDGSITNDHIWILKK